MLGTAEYGSTASSDWPGSGPRASVRYTSANSAQACSGKAATSAENSGLCLMVYDETTRRLGGSSREIAANRVLDLERLSLPLWLFAAAQPRLGRRPAGAAVLADEDDSIPGLDDVAEGPQVPG